MRISQMSTLSGASPRSLRHYEAVGLLRPRRSPSGQRTYAVADVDRVVTIQHLLAAGLTTEAHRIDQRRRDLTRQLAVLHELLGEHP